MPVAEPDPDGPEPYRSAPEPEAPDRATSDQAPGVATDEEQSAGTDRRRTVALVTVVALVGIAAVFFVSFVVSRATGPDAAMPEPTRSASPTSTPTPTPSPTVAAAPSAPAAPGIHAWTELAGGECLTDYASPWAETFTVVPCTESHTAQLVARASLSDDPAAAYPGEAEITSRLGLSCSAPEVIDYARASAYPDVRLQAAYPPDAARWAAGERSYFCFASLAGGGQLTDSIAVGR